MTDVANQPLEVLGRIQQDIADVKQNTAANQGELEQTRQEVSELRATMERGIEHLVPAVSKLQEVVGTCRRRLRCSVAA